MAPFAMLANPSGQGHTGGLLFAGQMHSVHRDASSGDGGVAEGSVSSVCLSRSSRRVVSCGVVCPRQRKSWQLPRTCAVGFCAGAHKDAALVCFALRFNLGGGVIGHGRCFLFFVFLGGVAMCLSVAGACLHRVVMPRAQAEHTPLREGVIEAVPPVVSHPLGRPSVRLTSAAQRPDCPTACSMDRISSVPSSCPQPFGSGPRFQIVQMRRGSRYFDFEVVDDEGCIAKGTWRCWVAPPDNLRWEARRVILSGGYGAKVNNLQFSKAVKPEMGQWQAAFADLGVDSNTAWVRSIHAARKKGDHITQEDDLASFSTAGVLAILLFWCEYRRELARKASARCVLKTFLERSLTVGLAKAFGGPLCEQS